MKAIGALTKYRIIEKLGAGGLAAPPARTPADA
jgi:hypothetical protein